ncbi:hypothetical protein [Dyella sp. S184]|uniref:hypothetical protein n=1 Tax=Dyella sp. S184 TaxID=1641862 RepID=UPI00131B0C1F|nr:hypothetical protein [Dyella sp. S184]
MITGLGIFTAIHTLLSIVALLSGMPLVADLLRGSRSSRWFGLFWTTAAATSVTGFFFPFHGMTPAIGVGVVAVIILAVVLMVARGTQRSRLGSFIFASGLVTSEYLLVFVAIAQAFGKIPLLHAAAPTLKEPPFAVAQFVALAAFVLLGILATKKLKVSVL